VPPPTLGERWAKEVTFDALVRRPAGETEKREIVATLERAVTTIPQESVGRWIVTELVDRGPSARQAG
jgi:hypothetical protein